MLIFLFVAEEERFFYFVGRIIGLAVFHRHFLDAVFVPSFYKGLVW